MFGLEVPLGGVCLAWRRGVFGLEVHLGGSWRGVVFGLEVPLGGVCLAWRRGVFGLEVHLGCLLEVCVGLGGAACFA